MKSKKIIAALLVALGLAVYPVAIAAATTYAPELMSQTTQGVVSNAGGASKLISSDNRYVVFSSSASNLDSSSNDYIGQVYLRDRTLNTTTLVSTDSQGGLSQTGAGALGFSSNGRYVYFSADFGDQSVPGFYMYAYVKDLTTGVTSPILAHDQYNNQIVPTGSSISSTNDGTVIIFSGRDYSEGSTNNSNAIYSYNLLTGDTSTLVHNANMLTSKLATVPGGVEFAYANPLTQEVYLYNTSDNSSIIIGTNGNIATGYNLISLSSDGRYLFYVSYNPNETPTTPADCQYGGCLYKRDFINVTTVLINPSYEGVVYTNIGSYSISSDGNILALGDINNSTGVVIDNLLTGAIYVVGYGPNYIDPDYAALSDSLQLSEDGSLLLFQSFSSNFGTPPSCNSEDGSIVMCPQLYIASTLPKPLIEAPSNLSSTTPTNSSRTLAWSGSASATTYNIYRNNVKIGSTSMTNYTDSSSIADGTYQYYVTAGNTSGESSPSNTVDVTYDKTRPTVAVASPNPFATTYTTGPSVTVTASDSGSGLQQLVIHVYKSNGQLLTTCGAANAAQLAAGSQTCSLAGLSNGTYYIKTGAFDNAGNNKTVTTSTFTISH